MVRPLPVHRWVVVQEHAPLAPIEHVDRDHDVPLSGQLGADALSTVALLLECRQVGMLLLGADHLFLSPQIDRPS